MDIYRRNSEARQQAKAQIMESQSEDSTSVNIENSMTPKGYPTIKMSINKSSYYVHSAYEPQNEASKLIDTLDFSKNILLIVWGLGLGYHLFEIKKRMSAESLIVVIEPSRRVFENAMQTVDIRELLLSENFIFLIGYSEEEVHTLFTDFSRETAFVYLASNMQFLKLSAYDKLFPDTYKNLTIKIINATLFSWHSLGNSITDTLLGLAQSFSNIDVLIENVGINELNGRYENLPAIIVSAGPSLDKNVNLLKEAKGKALIIATDAVLEMLLNRGIEPDAVVSFERYLVYEQLFSDKNFSDNVVLIALSLLQPKVFEAFEKNKKVICIKKDDTFSEWLDSIVGPLGTVSMGNCVAHMAFGVAKAVKANPIIFIGQDLAFGPEMQTHSLGVAEEVRTLAEKGRDKSNLTTVMGNSGKPLASTILWKTFLAWFEGNILKDSATTYINATEGGARIKGTMVMTLQETIEKYCNTDIPKLKDVIPKKVEVDKVKMYNDVIVELQRKINFFSEINNLSKDAYNKLEQIKQNGFKLNKDIINVLAQTDKIVKQVSNDDIAMLFFQAMISNLIVSVNDLGLDITEDTIKKNINVQGEFLYIIKESSFIITNILFELLDCFRKKMKNPDAKNVFDEIIARVSQNLEYVLKMNNVL